MKYAQIANKVADLYNQSARQVHNYSSVPVSLGADLLSSPKRLHDHLYHYFDEVYEEKGDGESQLLDSARANSYMMQQTFSVLVGYVGFVANSALSEQSLDTMGVALSIATPIFVLSAPAIKAWDCLVEDCDGDVFPRFYASLERARSYNNDGPA